MAVSGWAAANSAMRLSKATILARKCFSSATNPRATSAHPSITAWSLVAGVA